MVTAEVSGHDSDRLRQMAEGSGFFGYFFTPFMNRVRTGESLIQPVLISKFVRTRDA
jgi:hypothetical protein